MSNLASAICNWLQTICDSPGYYKYSKNAYRPYSAESSAQAVGILGELGLVSALSQEQRQAHIQALQSFQAEDGSFGDPLVSEDDRIDKTHPWTKINEHISGACEQALSLLGASPLYPNTTAPIFDITKLDPDDWIRSLDHREVPWGRCHNVSFSLLLYRKAMGLYGDVDAKTARIYELIESEMLNPIDGMPGATDHPIGRRIAGYYMLLFCYLPFGRALPNPEAAIDLILNAQNEEGEIGEGGMCQNWDAMYVLNCVSREINCGYRHDEVCALSEKLSAFLLKVHRKQDGGFSFNRDYCQLEHNQVRVAPANPESDTQGTLMSLACLNITRGLLEKKAWNTFLDNYFYRMEQSQKVASRHVHDGGATRARRGHDRGVTTARRGCMKGV